jgi:hypothetical protein
MVAGVLSFIGLVIIIAIVLVALVIGVVVRAVRGKPRRSV